MQQDIRCYYSILQHVFRIIGMSLLRPTNNEKSLTPILRGIAKFGRGRDRCSEQISLGGAGKLGRDKDNCSKISDTILYSNIITCITHNSLVSYSTLVPTKNAKSLTQILRGRGKCTLVPTKNAKSLTPLLTEDSEIFGI